KDARVRRTLMALAEPGFEVAMIGPAYLGRTVETSGAEGFREVWLDWTSAFESYRIDLERMIDAGERVVSLVTMCAKTRTGAVEIEELRVRGKHLVALARHEATPKGTEATVEGTAAAVMTLRDGRLARIEFNLDRDAALRAAGLEE